MAAIIQTEDLQKRFGREVMALDGVTISVEEGEYVTVTGRSGSGKSTLLNIIGCLDQPTGGTVRIAGATVDYTNQHQLVDLRRTRLGFVFQHFSLISGMTASENVEYPLIFSGVPKTERKKRAMEMLELVGILDRADHLPGELSGGQQQRVAISRALVANPSLVLADEPTGNLDSTTGGEIISLMKSINDESGTTFLIVTHEPGIWIGTDQTIHLADGRLVA
ncbi:ABC transporter ATP-binding protein [Methanocalculus sp.]|uniref:ABC transporter ATP-binding protein n=1 Tax=Methanocalculus sp. TaxID=2004547 RepID=UPI00271F72A5|nr:ABC transporter ATP-binding protein [Methanocalculus sp.]MDO8841662.1 ABC transporter ATP-binding protein [Methanocalculus sp.]